VLVLPPNSRPNHRATFLLVRGPSLTRPCNLRVQTPANFASEWFDLLDMIQLIDLFGVLTDHGGCTPYFFWLNVDLNLDTSSWWRFAPKFKSLGESWDPKEPSLDESCKGIGRSSARMCAPCHRGRKVAGYCLAKSASSSGQMLVPVVAQYWGLRSKEYSDHVILVLEVALMMKSLGSSMYTAGAVSCSHRKSYASGSRVE
jgi:hypothetical protein